MSYEINVTVQKQPGEDDCWATCASMVLKAKGCQKNVADVKHRVAAAHINGYTFGGRASIAEAGWAIKKLSSEAVTFEFIKSAQEELTWGMDEFKARLNKSCLILISIANHMMLVVGYTGDSGLCVVDPAKGARGTMQFSDLKASVVEASAMRVPLV